MKENGRIHGRYSISGTTSVTKVTRRRHEFEAVSQEP